MLAILSAAILLALSAGGSSSAEDMTTSSNPGYQNFLYKKCGVKSLLDISRDTSIAIMQNGKLIQRASFQNGDSDKNQIMSITKSITSLLTGIAVEEKILPPLDSPLGTHLPALQSFPYKEETLQHILQHDSCFSIPASIQREEIWSRSAVNAFDLLSIVKPSCEDQRVFSYSNLMPNVISQSIEIATGECMQEYAAAKLFRPLGIDEWSWKQDEAGHTPAEAGLQLTAADLAKIGQLVLQDGLWEGNPVVPKWYVDKLLEPSTTNSEHSLLWWLRQSDMSNKVSGKENVTLEGNGWAGQVLVIDRQMQRVTVILTRPDWAWELYNGCLSYDDAEQYYRDQMVQHEDFVENIVIRHGLPPKK